MKRIFIKPLNNLKVFNPFTKRYVAPGGEETIAHTYWTRLEKQGDIEISEKRPEQTETKPKKGDK
jgi:hypothetical protein